MFWRICSFFWSCLLVSFVRFSFLLFLIFEPENDFALSSKYCTFISLPNVALRHTYICMYIYYVVTFQFATKPTIPKIHLLDNQFARKLICQKSYVPEIPCARNPKSQMISFPLVAHPKNSFTITN